MPTPPPLHSPLLPLLLCRRVRTVLQQAQAGAFALPPTTTTAVSGAGCSTFLSPPLSPRAPCGQADGPGIPMHPPHPIPAGLV